MDQGGRIRRYCAEHREPAIILEQAEHCEVCCRQQLKRNRRTDGGLFLFFCAV